MFVTFVKYFLDTKISRRVVKKYEHSKEEKGFNKNMSVLFKVFTLEQRDVLEKHVLPKLWKRERIMLRQLNRESRVAMQTVLSAKDYFGLAFPFHVPTHINEIIQASRDLEMVRYAHEHLHYKFQKEPQM